MAKLKHYQVIECYAISIIETEHNRFRINGSNIAEAQANTADPDAKIIIVLNLHSLDTAIIKSNKVDLICRPLDRTALLLDDDTFYSYVPHHSYHTQGEYTIIPSITANRDRTKQALYQTIKNNFGKQPVFNSRL